MKIRLLTALSVVSLLSAACTQELAEPQSEHVETGEVKMNISLPDVSVKTGLGPRGEGGYPTLWSEGDMISLHGVKSKPLSAEGAGKSTATFQFKGDISYPYNILYPATEKSDEVNFPSMQRYLPGTFDPAAVPMFSSSRSFENASLSHLSSLLKFSLKSDENVTLSLVQVSSMGGEHLSGSFKMQTDADGLFTGGMTAGDGSVSTTISFGEQGLMLSSDPQDIFVSIPHGTYSKGFTVLLITNDDRVMNLKFYTKDGEKDIAPAKVIEFETVEYAGVDSILLIKTVEDLQALGSRQNQYAEAVLISDLDFTGREWTPIDNISLVLNGAGHVLKGLPAPLCKTLVGTVKDLNIYADIDLSSGSRVAAFAEVVSAGGLLCNCITRGQIKVSDSSASGDIYLAGLVALVEEEGAVDNSVNYADVQIDSKSGDIRYLYAGGCVAFNKGNLSDIVNAGTVMIAERVAPTTRLAAGGVVAAHTSGKITGLVNKAHVSVAGGTTGASGIWNFVGGVIGYNNNAVLDGTMLSNTSGSSVEYTVVNNAASPAVGGLVGYNAVNGGKLISLVNNSSVNIIFPAGISAKSDMKIGGVAGYWYYSGMSVLECKGCVNKGDITTAGRTYATEDMAKGVQIGGIIGRCQISGSDEGSQITILGCSNEGNIVMNESDAAAYNFVGGIIGTYSALNSDISECVNRGNIIKNGDCAGAVFMGGICGSAYRADKSSHIWKKCTNEGNISLVDEESSGEVATGGIIGNISGLSGKTLTMKMSECVNNGQIDRLKTKYSKNNSYAGGIVGALGKSHATTSDGYVTAELYDCRNTGRIIFNQFCGFDSFHEETTNVSFTGGIVGMSNSRESADIVCCENSGDILSTSGQHGGIIGFMRRGTTVRGDKTAGGVRYTVNRGNVCDHSPDENGIVGSGYCIAGGIAGYLRDNCKIEYAWNAGNVSGSVNNGTEPCAGGIIGQYSTDKAVRYCKNSGSIRNYVNGSNKLQYCGAISGTDPDGFGIEYCGVGGRVYRTSGWIILEDGGTYPYQNYIFRNTAMLNDDKTPVSLYPENVVYKGCCFWNSTSVLPWEMTDWVEPE